MGNPAPPPRAPAAANGTPVNAVPSSMPSGRGTGFHGQATPGGYRGGGRGGGTPGRAGFHGEFPDFFTLSSLCED